MGNDPDTRKIHFQIYKFCSQYIYPKHYRFNKKHLIKFDWGFYYGRNLYRYVRSLKNKTINNQAINKLNLSNFEQYPVAMLRSYLGITMSDLNQIEAKSKRQIKIAEYNTRKRITKKHWSKGLKISGSVFAVLGGFILASKLSISGYGFIFLACSSSQLLIASILDSDITLICYSTAVFVCVDLYGVYRWLLT